MTIGQASPYIGFVASPRIRTTEHVRYSPTATTFRKAAKMTRCARTGPSLPAFSRLQATLGRPNAPTTAVLPCPTGPGLLAQRLPRDRQHDRGPTLAQPPERLVAFWPLPFRTHAHVLVRSSSTGRRCGIVGRIAPLTAESRRMIPRLWLSWVASPEPVIDGTFLKTEGAP